MAVPAPFSTTADTFVESDRVLPQLRTGLSVGGIPTVSSRGDFNAAVATISSGGYLAEAGKSYLIDITADFAVDGDLARIALMAGSTLVIRGHGKTMDGGDLYRGIQVDSGTVTLESLTIANMRARGGDGGGGDGVGGGGGGAGMGGGLFVAAAGNVVLDRVTFTSNIAEGGSGSAGFDGPGGGLNGGAGGGLAGPLDALDPDRRQTGGFGGGGGTAGFSQYGGRGGYGGGGGSSSVYGGFTSHRDGAGNGAVGFGGGGDGIAADIYAEGGLTILGTASVSGSTVVPGQSGGGEAKAGSVGDASIFASSLSLATQAGETIRLAGGIGGGLSVGGAGTVVLSGANSVGGGTVLGSGTLELGNPRALGEVGSNSWSLGTGWVQFIGAATLVLTNAALVGSGTDLTYPGLIDGFTLGGTIRLPGLPFDAAATVTSEGKNAVLTTGGTSVTLTGLGGFFAPAPVDDGSGGTMLRGGLTARVDTQAELDAALIAMSYNTLFVDDHLVGGGGALGTAYVIDIIGDFTLSHDMLPIYLGAGSSLTVNGNGHRVDGADLYQGFDLRLGALTLRSLTVADMLARGGSGFGGALFVGADTQVVLNNVDFDSNGAVGGAVGGAGASGSNGTGGAANGVEGGYYASGAFGVGGRPLDNLAAGGFGGGGGGAPTGGVAGYGAGAGVPGAGGGGLAAGDTSAAVQANWTVTGSGTNPADAGDMVSGAFASGVVAFAIGETRKTITVAVQGDAMMEASEDFTVTLSAPSGALLGTTSASGSILDDDGAAIATTMAIAATDATRAEGDSGATAFTFTVSRTGGISGASSAAYAVTGAGLRPALGSDFIGGVLPGGIVDFLPGATSAVITIAVSGDTLVEASEGFAVTLSAPSQGVEFAAISAVGEIGADDAITDLVVVNSTTGVPLSTAPTYYTGPVAGVEKEFILIGPENINASPSGDNWFIHTGSGTDGIAAHGGRNVLDGGIGSNFLSGAGGEDTFFLDNRDADSAIWSTVVGFGKGDSATVWGVTREGFSISWLDDLGAEGYKGLTMLATAPGKPSALLTLAGFSNADVDSGKLVVLFGAIDASTPYLYVYGVS